MFKNYIDIIEYMEAHSTDQMTLVLNTSLINPMTPIVLIDYILKIVPNTSLIDPMRPIVLIPIILTINFLMNIQHYSTG